MTVAGSCQPCSASSKHFAWAQPTQSIFIAAGHMDARSGLGSGKLGILELCSAGQEAACLQI